MNFGLRSFPSPRLGALAAASLLANARELVLQSLTSATLSLSADEIILKDLDGNALLVSIPLATPLVLTMDTANGLNRLDTGSEAASSWYYVWAISDGVNVGGLLSLADGRTLNSGGTTTAPFGPIVPAGWNYRALIGVVRNDGSSNFVSFYQTGRDVIFATTNIFTAKAAVGANTYEVLSGGTLTTYQGTVPPFAKMISGTAGSVGAFASSIAVAADVNGLGAVHVNTAVGPGAIDTFTSGAPFRIFVSSQNLAWKCTDTNARNRLSISGFRL